MSNPQNHFKKGLEHLLAQSYPQAIEEFSTAIKLNPEYTDAYNNRGLAKDHLKQYNEAIEDYNKAIEIDPEYAKAYNNIGYAKRQLKQYKEAIYNLDKAIKIDSEFVIAYNNRGTVKYDLKQYKEAIEDYNKAIGLDSTNAKAYYNQGLAYQKLGEIEKAKESFGEASEIDPTIISKEQTKKLQEELEKKITQTDKKLEDNKEEIKEEVKEEVKEEIREEFKKTQDFQTILKDAWGDYDADKKWWLNASIRTSIATIVLLIASIILVIIFNNASLDKIPFIAYAIFWSTSAFVIALNFVVIRQYTNSKKLATETKNRLLASKMLEHVTYEREISTNPNENSHIKEIIYPKLVAVVVDSPYNQQATNYPVNDPANIASLMPLVDKLKK